MVKQKKSGQRLRVSGDPNKAKKKMSRRKLRAEGRQVWKKLRTESCPDPDVIGMIRFHMDRAGCSNEGPPHAQELLINPDIDADEFRLKHRTVLNIPGSGPTHEPKELLDLLRSVYAIRETGVDPDALFVTQLSMEFPRHLHKADWQVQSRTVVTDDGSEEWEDIEYYE
ncbi:hypothetical protein S7711_10365 [Stachybotrys chartarum IBT 7711]|uniref:Uncharacterized protein n=1 Tax=Stachybotrys chartarum (strain CBS 109288 / IBT 7711) TaxID=1280523 RepID=A0A084ATJ2_STACB|nr:hypothetical protein S7711_10365 [Stachybotrys chartarum IBT 7711]KFA49780.1 hypothetical protein S40293_10499 [Stachybotrys chartarum IBT 40293]KFA77377.1 hypothetical protein S40288_10908 [Stachybotrys chartarum IBT 40288]